MQNSAKSRCRIGSFALQIPLPARDNICFSPCCCRMEKSFSRACQRGCKKAVAFEYEIEVYGIWNAVENREERPSGS